MGKFTKTDITSVLQQRDKVQVSRTIKLNDGTYKDYMDLVYLGFGKVRVIDTRRIALFMEEGRIG